jgi:hypothetical protein
MTGGIEIITEAGYKLSIGVDYTYVTIAGKTKRFIGVNHRRQAVEYVIKAA